MKKFLGGMLATLTLASCLTVPGFAVDSDQTDSYWTESVNVKYSSTVDSTNTTRPVPTMTNTQKIGGVTFSKVNKVVEYDADDENGVKYHGYLVYVGNLACMRSDSNNTQFTLYPYGQMNDSTSVTIDEGVHTSHGDQTLESWGVNHYNAVKGSNGLYKSGLIWEFDHNTDGKDETTSTWAVRADVNGQTYYYNVFYDPSSQPNLPTVDNNAPTTVTATPASSTVYVDGKAVMFEAYTINGNNYFKLRDLALVMRGTSKQFEVTWDPDFITWSISGGMTTGAIEMTSGKPYTTVGGELKAGDGTTKTGTLNRSALLLDGLNVYATAYIINGEHFFDLNDIARMFDFWVDWDGTRNAIVINSTMSYNAAEPEQQESVANFTDVPANAWYYDYVSRMVQDGLFAGTSSTTFSPDAPMSEVQFLTVVLRKAFSAELDRYNAQYTSAWYDGAYHLGLDKGIISPSVYGSGADMNRSITRERMTDMAVKGLEAMGRQTYANASGVEARVTDLDQCAEEMRDSVVQAYTMGIISGTTSSTVSPKQTATRAQGATILYRFAYFDESEMPDLSVPVEKPAADLSQPITIYEGQTRLNYAEGGDSRLAREGDIFVKADGTKVVLKKGPNGVLGEGQGVAPDLGFKFSQTGGLFEEVINQERVSTGVSLGDYYLNSIGKGYNNDTYKVNPWTGEGHWGTEWSVIKNANPMPATKGTYDGQISSNGVWVWDGILEDWDLCCNWPDTSYFE